MRSISKLHDEPWITLGRRVWNMWDRQISRTVWPTIWDKVEEKVYDSIISYEGEHRHKIRESLHAIF